MAQDATLLLLDLPTAMLREVISWSPSGATANALLNTCRAAQQQRHDPTMAALLLLRCPCSDYTAAMASCAASCHGGASAVVQQLLQRVGARPDSSGPTAAPAPLLHAALCAAAWAGDDLAVRALMALPQPPHADAFCGLACLAALGLQRPGVVPHLGALQALLECGADPCVDNMSLLHTAGQGPANLAATLLLLQHCPPARLGAATTEALDIALCVGDMHALGCLLAEAPFSADTCWNKVIGQAAGLGDLPALHLLLDHCALRGVQPVEGVSSAISGGHVACAALLLERGAAVSGYWDIVGLFFAGHQVDGIPGPMGNVQAQAMLTLLLRHGAVATPFAHHMAERHGRQDLLIAAINAAAAAADA